jgi:chromosomal replication initiation ATPase DnaA
MKLFEEFMLYESMWDNLDQRQPLNEWGTELDPQVKRDLLNKTVKKVRPFLRIGNPQIADWVAITYLDEETTQSLQKLVKVWNANKVYLVKTGRYSDQQIADFEKCFISRLADAGLHVDLQKETIT